MLFEDWVFENYRVRGSSQWQLSDAECPFCGTTGSDVRLYFNKEAREDGTYGGFCHHCGRGFNNLQFASMTLGKSIREVKKFFSEGDGYVRKTKPKENKKAGFPKTMPISASANALDYMRRREILAAESEFGLKFIPDDLRGADGELVSKCGNRIFIPIHDEYGTLSSWQARAIFDYQKPKYLFAPGFSAEEHLFNCHRVKKEAPFLILVEGVMDAFGWCLKGVTQNVVASFGKKISAKQVTLLKKLNPMKLLLAWDFNAQKEMYRFCENYGHLFDIRIVPLPGKDADECSVIELVEAAKSSYKYSWELKIKSSLN